MSHQQWDKHTVKMEVPVAVDSHRGGGDRLPWEGMRAMDRLAGMETRISHPAKPGVAKG